jgi:hypothetical protein
VVMKSIIFWDVTPWDATDVSEEHIASIFRVCLPPAYLLVLAEIFLDPEDGGDMFLRNVGCISTDYTASHSRRWYSPFITYVRKRPSKQR